MKKLLHERLRNRISIEQGCIETDSGVTVTALNKNEMLALADEIEAIIGDDYASDWAGYTNNYSCDEVYIGYTPTLRKRENGSYRDLSVQEICDQLTSAETAAKARRVYEAICGEPPETEPQFELFARWW